MNHFRKTRGAIAPPGRLAACAARARRVLPWSESFIDHVENVTTGDSVRKGQPLMHVHSPAVVAASAQYVSNLGFEGARRRLENLNVSAEAMPR